MGKFLKYWSGTILDKFRYIGSRNNYKLTVIANIEFIPSSLCACNKIWKVREAKRKASQEKKKEPRPEREGHRKHAKVSIR